MTRIETKCEHCGVDLATHLDSGILMCAHTHREQYEKAQAVYTVPKHSGAVVRIPKSVQRVEFYE